MSEVLSLPRLARRLGITRKWLKSEATAAGCPASKLVAVICSI